MSEELPPQVRHSAFGMPLSGIIAKELVLEELKGGIALKRMEIAERILAAHNLRGGRDTSLDQAVRVVKGIMKILVNDGLVERPMSGWYRIDPESLNFTEADNASLSTPIQLPFHSHIQDEKIDPQQTPDNKPGVYVYSYPRYMPSEDADSANLIGTYKIGASINVADRVQTQRRQTEVPEDLVLVRVFYTETPFELEAKFHSILRAANMHQKTTQGGVEWFSCNLATIDAIAAALGKAKND